MPFAHEVEHLILQFLNNLVRTAVLIKMQRLMSDLVLDQSDWVGKSLLKRLQVGRVEIPSGLKPAPELLINGIWSFGQRDGARWDECSKTRDFVDGWRPPFVNVAEINRRQPAHWVSIGGRWCAI